MRPKPAIRTLTVSYKKVDTEMKLRRSYLAPSLLCLGLYALSLGAAKADDQNTPVGTKPSVPAASTAVGSNDHETSDESAALKAFESSDYDYCSRTAMGEIGLDSCLGEQAAYAERRLNETYNRVMATLSPARQNALRQQERKWIKWREKECARRVKEVEECADGCGVPSTMEAVCMTKEADKRSLELESKILIK